MSGHADMAPVVVLGAGLSGASVALELAARGIPVVLLERDRLPFNRASLRNEGKIHLGFIYAGDTTRATAALQLQGALRFGGLMRRWLGSAAATLAHSTPFHYVVARDSIQRPGELEHHYRQVQRLHDEALAADPSLDYLGKRPSRLFERAEPASLRPFVDADAFDAVYRTEEVAIDPAQLADHVRDALANTPLIDLRTGHRVDTVRSKGPGFEVAGDDPRGGRWRIAGRQVVNCCWEDRPHIDHGAGLVPPPGWLHRLKYRVVARLPAALRGGHLDHDGPRTLRGRGRAPRRDRVLLVVSARPARLDARPRATLRLGRAVSWRRVRRRSRPHGPATPRRDRSLVSGRRRE